MSEGWILLSGVTELMSITAQVCITGTPRKISSKSDDKKNKWTRDCQNITSIPENKTEDATKAYIRGNPLTSLNSGDFR